MSVREIIQNSCTSVAGKSTVKIEPDNFWLKPDSHVITARVRSTREGNVLTPVCVSVHTFVGEGGPRSR